MGIFFLDYAPHSLDEWARPDRLSSRWRAGMAIMAFPDKGLSLFDFEKAFKAENTTSWPPARRAYTSQRIRHTCAQNVDYQQIVLNGIHMVIILVPVKRHLTFGP